MEVILDRSSQHSMDYVQQAGDDDVCSLKPSFYLFIEKPTAVQKYKYKLRDKNISTFEHTFCQDML